MVGRSDPSRSAPSSANAGVGICTTAWRPSPVASRSSCRSRCSRLQLGLDTVEVGGTDRFGHALQAVVDAVQTIVEATDAGQFLQVLLETNHAQVHEHVTHEQGDEEQGELEDAHRRATLTTAVPEE